ncbi:hypothetical protein FOMPIDRAFT_1051374 [Fomitopsis schrenkii]|uniref:Snf7-domain-containing protein n=1 Tax=Fomitopsis schrenkii TaxID=2126942 RepID=S8E544_FOMSC|nr:hypothetical protein FOMPIDRAFT_1051374 [Fomitopsis schrenkii]
MSQSRLKKLYSDFSLQKHSDPTSYASILEWWRRTLETVVSKGWLAESDAAASQTDRLVLHAPGTTLADEFRYEGVGKPLGLPTVIAELCSSKAYVSLSDFLNSTQSIYDPGWLPYRVASYVVGKPLWWALKQLSIVSADEPILGDISYGEKWKRVKGDYVVVSLLERAADSVIARQRSKGGLSLADALYNLESFREEFAAHALDNVVLSELDIRVLVRYLERDRKVVVTQGGVIKFLEPTSTEPPEVTAVDTGVLEVKTAVDKLQAQVDSIQSKISLRAEQIKTALQQKRKEIALSHLRAQKRLEALLKQRLESLDTLHSTLLRVEQSAGDIMKSYESSTATLRAILAHPSLQREKIDETMEAMASANEDAKEIDDAIRIGADIAQGSATIDDAELEDEWKALVQEAEKESAAKAEEEKARKEEEEARVTEATLAAEALRVPSEDPTESTKEDRVPVEGQA